jgi:hypothetical protein
MLTALTVLVVVLAGVVLAVEGAFRAAAALGSVFFGGLVAFNTFMAFADAFGPDQSGLAVVVLLLAFLVSSTVLFGVASWLAPGPARAPWLLDRLGGFALGAAAGWLLTGVFLSAVRLSPSIDGWVRSARGNDGLRADCAEGYWLGVVRHVSERGLQASPARPFEPTTDFLERFSASAPNRENHKVENGLARKVP